MTVFPMRGSVGTGRAADRDKALDVDLVFDVVGGDIQKRYLVTPKRNAMTNAPNSRASCVTIVPAAPAAPCARTLRPA